MMRLMLLSASLTLPACGEAVGVDDHRRDRAGAEREPRDDASGNAASRRDDGSAGTDE
jgi:hypothetical protein